MNTLRSWCRLRMRLGSGAHAAPGVLPWRLLLFPVRSGRRRARSQLLKDDGLLGCVELQLSLAECVKLFFCPACAHESVRPMPGADQEVS